MLNSGKKIREKKSKYSNSHVVRKKISERNKKPLLIDWFTITVEYHSFLNSKRFGQLLIILNSGLYGLNIKVSFHWSKDLNWHFCGKLFTHLVKRYS
jgi:hypothetical protein